MGARKAKTTWAAPVAAPRRPGERWDERDRIGGLSLSVLTDLRVRTSLGTMVDPSLVARAVSTLEDIVEVVRDEESDSMVVAEEVVDFLRRTIAAKTEAVDEAKDTERKCEEEIASINEARDNARKDHETDMSLMAETCSEFRKRAELAEYRLAEAHETIRLQGAKLEDRDTEITALEKALEVARAAMRPRRRKTS